MKAVVLLSGGLDSTTTLYVARCEGREAICLSIHYGQRHERELEAAKKITSLLKLEHWLIPLSLPWGGSALTDNRLAVPKGRNEAEIAKEIPVTYVPARNSIFLSLAASLAEVKGAAEIYFGANILDYSGYPDCRPEFIEAFEEMIARGTRVGAGLPRPGRGDLAPTDAERPMRIITPLLRISKADIVRLGHDLGVPFEWTWSCYAGEEFPCGECDSCILRAKGFKEAGIEDPLVQPSLRGAPKGRRSNPEIASVASRPRNDH